MLLGVPVCVHVHRRGPSGGCVCVRVCAHLLFRKLTEGGLASVVTSPWKQMLGLKPHSITVVRFSA